MSLEIDQNKILNWSNWQAAFALILYCSSVYLANMLIFACFVLTSYIFFSYIFKKELEAIRPFGGYANWVTFFRGFMISFGIIAINNLSRFEFTVIMAGNVLLDVLDGFLARKFNTQSSFGAYLDLETDAFFVAVTSIYLWINYEVSALVLLVGGLRYFYVIALSLVVKSPTIEPKRRYASWIAGSHFILLILNISTSSKLLIVFLHISCLFVLFSFLRSFIYQFSLSASNNK